MPTDEDDWFAESAGRIDMVGTRDFEPCAGYEAFYLSDMRIFRNDTAEIVPHLADHPFAVVFRKLRHGQFEVAARPFGDAEAWSYAAGDPTADGRGGIDR